MPTRTSKRNERLFSLSTSASSFGQFLFYRPVRTVTGLIARSIFILPSCRNRHRTHHRWWRRITSILDFIIRISFVNIKTFFSIPNITAPKNPHIKTVQFLYDSDKTFHWKMWVFCTNRRIISGVVIFLHRKNLKPNVKNILTSVFGLSLFQMAIRMPISIMASGHWSKIIWLIPTDLIFLISVGRKSILRQTVKR